MAVTVEFTVPNLWGIFKWCEDCKKEVRDGVEGRKKRRKRDDFETKRLWHLHGLYLNLGTRNFEEN